VESHLYSLSFAPNPSWTHRYSSWSEIQRYLRDVAERFGVLPHIRFEHEVLRARWLADTKRWELETNHGTFTADVFVGATGGLSEPKTPALPGLERFTGKSFHSARWDHAHDLAGRKVAVVGTGASAIQFVPHIQPKVAKLSVFQRTAPWIMPRGDRAFTEAERERLQRSPMRHRLLRARIQAQRELFGAMFFDMRIARAVERLARLNLARQVRDRALRAKLTPSYTFGCKRILLSDDYLPALTRPNVEVVTSAIREVRERAVVTEDGSVREVDTLVFGTGFLVQEFPFGERVVGRSGESLADVWRAAGGMSAHLGTTISGFPNLFVLQGPNTGLGHTSVLLMMEAQMDHIVSALRFMRRHGYASVEPRPEAQAAFVAEVDRKMEGTVWTAGRCASWYIDAKGRNSTLWPGFTFTFRRRVERFEPAEYLLTGRANAEAQANARAGAGAGARSQGASHA
jgi:cation diffusion facilitator CzcD-associated flavoprotein CzcO